MKKSAFALKAISAISLVIAASQVSAHVGYGSALYSGAGVYDPLTNSYGAGTYGAASSFTSSASSNAGFAAGLDSGTLGNTHDIRFRYFTLATASQVSFTIKGLANSTVSGNANAYLNGLTASTLNPAFSIYSGVLPASSHDGVGDNPNVRTDADISTYLATANDFAAWSPFAGVNTYRNGLAAGAPGNTTGLWGVFDSNGSITTGNDSQWGSATVATDPAPANGIGPYVGSTGTPKIGTITYTGISGADAAIGASFVDSLGVTQVLAGADGSIDNVVTWSGILGPGIYTLAIGGTNLSDFANLYNDVRSSSGGLNTSATCGATTCANLYAADRLSRSLQIQNFTVAPVPVPAAAWLMGSGLLGLAGISRRKK